MKKIDINDAQHPIRQTAIQVMHNIAKRIGDEKIFDCKNGDTKWYDIEDMVTNAIDGSRKKDKDTITRRNKQIKNLKREIDDLLNTEMNAHGETLRIILNR